MSKAHHKWRNGWLLFFSTCDRLSDITIQEMNGIIIPHLGYLKG
jgi:hypothetical protein